MSGLVVESVIGNTVSPVRHEFGPTLFHLEVVAVS